jgi:hypothetical protein
MNLKKTALLAEVIGGVGIIVSILYLAFEVSESTKNTQISNHLALIELASEFKYLRMTNPDMTEIILRGSSDPTSLSETDQVRFRSYAFQALDIWETAFLMNESDVLPAGAWDVWNDAWCNILEKPGYRAIWDAGAGGFYISKFRDNVDVCFAN